MSDDQRMLHALIQRLEGGGSAEVVLVDQNVGEVDAGKEIDIDLKAATHVVAGGVEFKVSSPLIDEPGEGKFNREVLLNNPSKIIRKLQNSTSIFTPKFVDELD